MAQIEDIGKVVSEVDRLRGNLNALEEQARRHDAQSNHREAEQTNQLHQQKKTIDYLIKAFEKSVNDAERDRSLWGTEVKSAEQGIKRLERQIEILSKELATLKKVALTGADVKALGDRIKKLEK